MAKAPKQVLPWTAEGGVLEGKDRCLIVHEYLDLRIDLLGGDQMHCYKYPQRTENQLRPSLS